MPTHHRINLRDNQAVVGPFPISRGQTRISASLYSSAGSTYVVTMQHSLSIERDMGENDMTQWVAFVPARTMSSTSPAMVNRPVTGVGNVRFIVSTQDSTANTAARLVVTIE